MKRAIEVGQAVCALAALAGLFMLLSLPWFLVVTGVVGAGFLTLVEWVVKLDAKPAPDIEPEPGTDGA
jgi:hypothetical protein